VRASERYLALKFGFNKIRGAVKMGRVGTAFPHLFFSTTPLHPPRAQHFGGAKLRSDCYVIHNYEMSNVSRC